MAQQNSLMNGLNGDLGFNNLEARRRQRVRELAPNGTFWHSGKKDPALE